MSQTEDAAATSQHDNPAETRSIEGRALSEGTQSRRSSITHPYRTLLNDTSFARCHLTATPAGRTETYTRCLFMLGNGTPIWDPLGNVKRPEKHLKSGVMIGDVGVLTSDGDFECYFNIFLPRTDDVQRTCPEDMVPLLPPPEKDDISTYATYFRPGTTLVSKGVDMLRRSASPLDIEFTIKAREGGVLVLPDGASREDLISTTRIRDYVQKHALSWYMFMNKQTNSEVLLPNGSLYVVTGCDKTISWAIAAGPQSYQGAGRPMSVRYQGEKSPVWQMSSRMTCKSTKTTDPTQKYAVFIRGMKVAVNIPDWTKHVLRNEPPDVIPFYNVLAIPVMGIRARYQSFIERRQNYPDKYLSQSTRLIFHPSDILLRFLLEESSTSDVAVAEDTLWSNLGETIVEGNALQIERLLMHILIAHDTLDKDGLAILIPRTSAAMQDASSNYLQRMLFHVPNLMKARSRRADIAHKLSKIFPGPHVPAEQLGL